MNKAGDGYDNRNSVDVLILKEANRLIAAGHNPMEFRKVSEQAGAEIVKELNNAELIEGKSDRVLLLRFRREMRNQALIAGVTEKSAVAIAEAGQGLESKLKLSKV